MAEKLANVVALPVFGKGATFSYTGTAGTGAAIVDGNAVDVTCTTDAYVTVGASTTATTTGYYVPAYQTRRFPLFEAGARVSAIQVAAGGNCYYCPVNVPT